MFAFPGVSTVAVIHSTDDLLIPFDQRNNTNYTVRWAPRSSCVKFVLKMIRM